MSPTCTVVPGNRSAGTLHPPFHKRKPKPAWGREGAEGESEDGHDPGGSAAEDLQRLRSGVHTCL